MTAYPNVIHTMIFYLQARMTNIEFPLCEVPLYEKQLPPPKARTSTMKDPIYNEKQMVNIIINNIKIELLNTNFKFVVDNFYCL